MENAVAIKEEMALSIDDVKKFIAPNATDKEIGRASCRERVYVLV